MQGYFNKILSQSSVETQYVFSVLREGRKMDFQCDGFNPPNPPDESGQALLLKREKQDNPKIIEILKRHKLIPIFAEQIERDNIIVAEGLQNKIHSEIGQTNMRMLAMLSEMSAINNILSKNNIFHVYLKGPVLCWQIYGNLHYRNSVDIDLYVHKKDLITTDKYLLQLGYKRIMPKKISALIELRNYVKKDWVYIHPTKKMAIELHFRLFSNVSNTENERILIDQNNTQTEIHGKSYPILSDELNFLFLCSHGSIHQWFRLMWLYDIYSILKRRALTLNWNFLINYSKKLRNTFSLVQAVKLCETLFDIDVPNEIETEYLKNKRTNDFLLKQALEAILHPISETVLKRISRLFYLVKLQKGFTYKFHTFFSGTLRFIVGKA